MTNWNDYSMKAKMPLGTTPLPTTPPPAPSPAQVPSSHGGLLSNLFNGIGQMGGIGIQSQQNPMNFIGGLLGSLFGNKQPETPVAKPDRQIIDKRPDDIQALVSMFNKG